MDLWLSLVLGVINLPRPLGYKDPVRVYRKFSGLEFRAEGFPVYPSEATPSWCRDR